jgi:hypothetical protein
MPVDFNQTGSGQQKRSVTVYQVDETTGTPTYYLVKKTSAAVSGQVKQLDYKFIEPKVYDKIVIQDDDVIEILDVKDENGDRWYEVPYLAQDTIQESISNTAYTDPELASYNSSAPYILRLKRTAKRFVTRFRADKQLELQFGVGISEEHDRDLIPNPENVGLGLKGFKREVDLSVDPANFLYSSTYGQAPSQTTLTCRYTVGQGLADNVPANAIQEVSSVSYANQVMNLDAALVTQARDSLAVNNPRPSKGGAKQEP